MIFSAASRYSTLLPTEDEGTIRPSSRILVTSTMATSIVPKKPSCTIMPRCERWMSAYFIFPELILSRMIGSDWYGARNFTASASASSPSSSAEVDAPVSREIANSSPRAWNSLARLAIAVGSTFG
jgi:hypothetical protein